MLLVLEAVNLVMKGQVLAYLCQLLEMFSHL
jgi:hypothetical protein